MKKIFILAILMLLPMNASALTAKAIMKKSLDVFFYSGDDFSARVLMTLVSRSGKSRIREMTMIRKNSGPPGGEQKYFMYFHKPADVRKMTFMVYKYPDKDDDRWLFVPAINMTKRIAARDKTSSFAGSDFTYEDISGRNVDDDTHTLKQETQLNGRGVFVIKSTPKFGDVNYSYKLSWIDRDNFLPLKEEYYDLKGDLMKVFTADRTGLVKGFPTVVSRTMKNVQNGHRTEVEFLKTDYNLGVEKKLFSERFLKRPPRQWIK